MDHSSVANI